MMKNLNPKETFEWLLPQQTIAKHTLKIEVFSAITNDRILARYIHLDNYN